ncbi:MAG: FAD-dependent oxidoreductase [Dehalococcoidia bacterium]|nr:FAD-dependent oxidoreductase [Dehalococcoidia bacterium]
MEQGFDAIVVGAGPAGCACAYKLAKAGLQALVIDRGKFAGAKNMWGGAFYGAELLELLPDFLEEAPFERYVTRQKISFLTVEDCLSIDFASPKFSQPAPHGFVILRSKFDRWFADKAQEAGAIVAPGLGADDLLWDGHRVTGIKAGNDELPASAVIACDGANSVMAQKAGLQTELSPEDMKQGVKEVIELPREVIEQRFNLSGREGMAWEFAGSCTQGLPGGGFIYTNQDSISIGIVAQLNALVKRKIQANDLLEGFKSHPEVARLIEGGKLVEYSGHLIPVSGINMMPELYRDGFLVAGDAAALVLGTGLILEGANFAVASGIAAAETVIKAKEKGDFSRESLSTYQKLLEESYVLKDLKTFKKAPHFLENPHIYNLYPELACDLARRIFIGDGQPRKTTWNTLRGSLKGKASLLQILPDLWWGKGAI